MTTRRSVIANTLRVATATALMLGLGAVNTAHADPTGQNFVSVFLKYGTQPCYYDLAVSDGHGADHQAEQAAGSAFNFLNLFTFVGVGPLSQVTRQGVSQCVITTQDIV